MRCAFDARYPGFDQRPARYRLGPRPDLCDRRRCLRRLQHRYHGLRHRLFRNSGVRLGKPVSTTRVGWTVGGGLQYAVTNNWSVRAEYRFTDFGRINQTIFSDTNSLDIPDSSLYRKPPHTRKPGPGRRRLQIRLIRAASGRLEILSSTQQALSLLKADSVPASTAGVFSFRRLIRCEFRGRGRHYKLQCFEQHVGLGSTFLDIERKLWTSDCDG